MFITKKHLSRRTFLRGAGTTVTLPLLDAMIPAATALAATAAKPAPRLGFFYLPHGAIMKQWTPQQVGRDFQFSPILNSMEPLRKQVTIVSGLGNHPAASPSPHSIVPGTWLSCVHPRVGQSPFGGVTADQLAAAHIGQDTPLPSLEVAVQPSGNNGNACDRNYGCNYGSTISFRTPTTPLPMEHSPAKLFQRMFGRGDSAEERAAISKQQGSLLDMVADDVARLNRRLGTPDRVRLEGYLESVREVERQVKNVSTRDLTGIDLPEVPAAIPDSFDEHLNLMFDIIALAYQANMTRVVSFMMAAEGSNLPYTQIGVAEAFHPLSHHQDDATKIEKLIKIQRYHVEAFSRFAQKLAKIPDGDGSMLDHSLLLFGSNMSNSNMHDHFPLPLMLVGNAHGRVKGNQHLRYPDRTPLANLLMTTLDRVGVPAEKLGDGTETFSEV
jgi:hypothetical protein